MASFFNLTLDTIAPQDVTLEINDGATTTNSSSVVLSIGCSDADKTDYQMKIWGNIDGSLTESAAIWEDFATTKTVNLTASEGDKTIHVKVRDAVMNESEAVQATIELDTTQVAVTITYGPDHTRISDVNGVNMAQFTFTANETFYEFKVCVVPATTSAYDEGVVISMDNGSENTSGTGNYPADDDVRVKISSQDFRNALGVGSGPVEKLGIVKVFVYDGIHWSN